MSKTSHIKVALLAVLAYLHYQGRASAHPAHERCNLLSSQALKEKWYKEKAEGLEDREVHEVWDVYHGYGVSVKRVSDEEPKASCNVSQAQREQSRHLHIRSNCMR